MALPAELLAQLPPSVLPGGAIQGANALALSDGGRSVGLLESLAPVGAGESSQGRAAVQALQLGSSLDALLPDGGLPRGAVVELAVAGTAALGTSLGLAACRAVQSPRAGAQALATAAGQAWCAFIDPTGSLYAPAAARAGVNLERLLVLRPGAEALSRTALRLVESQAFPLVVVDLAGIPGKPLDVPLAGWARVVRRLAIAVEQTESTVLLITDAAAARPLPLPVAQRLELSLLGDQLSVRVAKDRRGRIAGPRKVRASALRSELAQAGKEALHDIRLSA